VVPTGRSANSIGGFLDAELGEMCDSYMSEMPVSEAREHAAASPSR
jgi:hypothetical protein